MKKGLGCCCGWLAKLGDGAVAVDGRTILYWTLMVLEAEQSVGGVYSFAHT